MAEEDQKAQELQLEQERQEKLKEDIKLQVEREMAALFELKFSQLEREL